MEDRRGQITRALRVTVNDRPQSSERRSNQIEKALSDAHRVLTSSDIPGAAKRDCAGCLIEKLVCTRCG